MIALMFGVGKVDRLKSIVCTALIVTCYVQLDR